MGERNVLAAEALIAVASAIARELAHDVAIVCVDRGGHVLASRRTDNTGYPAMEAARRKAATSAVMGVPTAMVAGLTGQDPLAALALSASPDMLAVPGGAPLVVDAVTVGGIGIAGAHYSEDEAILQATLARVSEQTRHAGEAA